jgi:hypothetical protein
MNGVFSALEKAGIAAKDMQTSGLSLYPRYDYLEVTQRDGSVRGEQKLAGYVASNNITARVRKLDTLGATIDSLVKAGGNTFSGVTFALDNDKDLKNQARTQAMKEALAKAELYANAAGLKVARIVTISEGYEYSPQPVMMARAVALGRVSSSIACRQARCLTSGCGRAADAAAPWRRPAAVGSRSTSASMNGLCVASVSIRPPAASAVTIRQRRSVSTCNPASSQSAGSRSRRSAISGRWSGRACSGGPITWSAARCRRSTVSAPKTSTNTPSG